MSVQETKLKDIADAIREKDGTTEPIPANDFPERIRGIPGGVEVKPERQYLYGFDINNADSNPATRVSYPEDVDNAGFAAARMNFDEDAFSCGGWPSTPGEKFMPRPCVLNFDGTVAYYLDPDDYAKKEDGTASDVANVSFGGNAMMEWPKIYTKRWETDGVYHFRCSDVKLDDDYECWCNYDRLDNEIPHFYTPIFFGARDSADRLRSISGMSGKVTNTLSYFVNRAAANGADWYIETISDRFLIQDLLVMMFKSTDLQTTAGAGNSTGSRNYNTGSMNDKGLFWGSDDGTSGVKVFGMEHWWGNLSRYTAGVMTGSYSYLVKVTRGIKDGSTAADYNFDGAGYKEIPFPEDSSRVGYISDMRTEAWGRLPVACAGSGTTFETDRLYAMNNNKNAVAGGYASRRLECGPFTISLLSDSQSSDNTTGAALSCKPLASIQTQN